MHFFLTKFNLKTPGREDDDADETKVTPVSYTHLTLPTTPSV